MGKGGCSKEAGRLLLWISWVTVWLITSIYVALAVITFVRLWEAATDFSYGANQLARNKIWRSPIAALVLSALLVFGFNFMSCITLIKKSINRGGPGFGYGFMMAFAFSLSMFLLLSGLVMDGFRPEVRRSLEVVKDANGTIIQGAQHWTKYSTELYIGTEVFALISFVTYFLFAIVMVILQAAISEHLGIESSKGTYAPAGGVADIVALPAPGMGAQDGHVQPPEYDQYAQYEQYAGYTQDGQQQQGGYSYDPNAAGYQAPVAPDAGGYYTAENGDGAGYSAADYQNGQYGQSGGSQIYTQAPGFAAVNAFNMQPANTGLMSGVPNPQAAYQYQAGAGQQV